MEVSQTEKQIAGSIEACGTEGGEAPEGSSEVSNMETSIQSRLFNNEGTV